MKSWLGLCRCKTNNLNQRCNLSSVNGLLTWQEPLCHNRKQGLKQVWSVNDNSQVRHMSTSIAKHDTPCGMACCRASWMDTRAICEQTVLSIRLLLKQVLQAGRLR